MKKLLSILTISTLTASVPAPLLANTVQTRVKRDVSTLTFNSNNEYLPIKEINGITGKIISLAVDSKNNIYFGVYENGAYVLKHGETTPTKIDGVSGQINSLAVDTKNNIYFATDNGVFVLKHGATTPTKIDGITFATAIAVDTKNNIYFGTYNGAFVLKHGTTTQTKINGIKKFVYSLAVDRKDNIYFSLFSNYLYKLQTGKNTATKIDEITFVPASLAIDSSNNIYFGIDNGAFVLKHGATTPTKINGINGRIKTAVDSKDNIYFGTNNGAFILQTALSWTKQQSQFALVDSAKTMTWTKPHLLSVDGELNIDITNPNIDKVVFDNVQHPQTNKHWTINVKPETREKDHNLQVTFTLERKQYTSEIIVSMQSKIEPTPTPVQQNLSDLIRTTDLGNIIDNNGDTIFSAVNQKNGNVIDDFSQIKITNKDNHSATLTAKPDSKSYAGSVDVSFNVIPATTVDLKIDVTSSASGVQIDKDYLAQLDSSEMTNKVDTFYYANGKSIIKIKQPPTGNDITGIVYGCDEQWNKTSQSNTIDPISGLEIDKGQYGSTDGRYLIELQHQNLPTHIKTIYLQVSEKQKVEHYWDTSNGKNFEQWADDNGYKNIRGYSASQLNNLLELSQTWKQSLTHLDLKLDNFVVDNIKNVSQDEIDNYKTKLLASVKAQVEKYAPDVVENTDYKILVDNLVAGDWTTSKDVKVQAVDGNTKLLSFDSKTIPVQQKEQPTPVQQNLSDLIRTTDLGNIIDNNGDTIFSAVNQKNGNVIDDFSQIKITNKDNHSATLTAKPDSKSYAGSVDVSFNVIPATTVDLKIDVTSSASGVQIDKDYLAQLDSSEMTNKVDTFYYANGKSIIKIKQPPTGNDITGIVYGCDEQWNKTSQSNTIDPISGLEIDKGQYGSTDGRYLIELQHQNLPTHIKTIYLQVSEKQKVEHYWDTSNGKNFEQWADDNGYKNIRGYSASQLNNLLELSQTWKQSLAHLDLKLDNFVVDNIKNVSQDEIDNYKTKLLASVKAQVEKYAPDVVENTDYKILVDNLVAGDWTTSKDVKVQAVDGNTKLLSFDSKTIPVQQKEQPTPVQQNLSDLIRTTDLGNIIDNNGDTIFSAVNQKNGNVIDDFSQIKITNKDNHSATLTAKPDSKSYAGSVDVSFNVIPATTVDLKIDVTSSASGVQIDKDYLAQLDSSEMTNKVDTFYYANGKSIIKIKQPPTGNDITGIVYGCDEQWNKTSQSNTIDPISGLEIDKGQYGSTDGRYLIELQHQNLPTHIKTIYLQVSEKQKVEHYWDTSNGKNFEQWADDNGYKNIRGYSASQLNNLLELSQTWKQSLAHLDLKLDNFVVDNIKNVSQDEIDNYKTKLLASVKAQVEKYAPDVVENTDYKILVDNLVAGDWTTSKDVKVQAVDGNTKLLSFDSKTIPVQQKEQPTPVQQNLSDLIRTTDLGNIIDNNGDTIFSAVNQKNSNVIDDFSQIKITNKDNHSATLTAKPDSKSYAGSVDVSFNVIPATTVDLKIDVTSSASGVQIDKDYLAQLDSSEMTNKVDTFYYANGKSIIKIKQPPTGNDITGIVYGCDEQWNKTSQSNTIDPISGLEIDKGQYGSTDGRYLIELQHQNLPTHIKTIYLQVSEKQKVEHYWDTSNGKNFEQWADDNGYKNIRGYSASQLNNLLELSQTWKQSLTHLDLKLDNFVVDNIKNVSQDEIDNYKTKLLASVKAQVEKYAPDVVENTDYKILVDNLVAGDWTTSKDVKVQAVDGNTKLLSFDSKTIPVQQKEQPTPVQQNLSDLIRTTDLGNIIDNNGDTIFSAVNQKNGNVIDDFSQIKITNKDNHSATLTAKPDSKSYAGSVDVSFNVIPATTVDLKIDVTSSASGVQIDKDYLAQLDSSEMTNKVDTFYYANGKSIIKIKQPPTGNDITGIVYGCDEQWNKTSQSNTIDPISGLEIDKGQYGSTDGRYLIELQHQNLPTHIKTIYLQVSEKQKVEHYWDTSNGKNFEQWADDNGYKNIRGYSASQLNNLLELSQTWKQSLAHLDLKLDNFVVDNIKNVSQDEIDNYKTKLLASVKAQVEKYAPDVVENTDYKILVDNLVAGDWTTSKDVKVQAVDGNTKLLSFDSKTIPVQQKEQPTPVQQNLSDLIRTTDLGNIIDNNGDTIFSAVNQKNGNVIDDFSQIKITNKDNHSATLTAKPDSKSYAGSVDVSFNVIPATTVDLKIDVTSSASGVQIDKDYLAQLDSSEMTNKVDTFYYANGKSIIKIKQPPTGNDITGIVYGCDEQWNKTSQSNTIDPISGLEIDKGQYGSTDGRYLIELQHQNLPTHIKTIYLQVSEKQKVEHYWDTSNGKNFEQWADDNGYKNIRGYSASQLNNLLELSQTWKQSLAHLDLKLDNFVVDNIKNVSQDEIDNYKTKLLASVKAQVEKYAPDVVENTDYKILVDNLVAGDWTTSKDVKVQAVDGNTKLLSFDSKTIPVQQKEQPTPVQQNLSDLIRTTDLGNIIDNNGDTIFSAVNQKNSNVIDDFSQIKITNKDNHSATLTAKPDSKSYAGSVDVSFNVIPATTVDLKIDVTSSASGVQIDKDYLAQLDSSEMTNKVDTFYYANGKSIIKIKQPPTGNDITGIVYGCDEQWNKTSQSNTIDPISGLEIDKGQYGSTDGRYLIELQHQNLPTHIKTIYLQVSEKQKVEHYWDTSNGKNFEQWADDNGYKNIRGYSASQLNNLLELSQTWKQSLAHLDLKLDNFVVDNIKNVSQDEIDNYKTKLLASVKAQVEKYAPDVVENTDYKILVDNLVAGDWTTSKDVKVQAVDGNTKLLSFDSKTIPVQQKEQPTPPTPAPSTDKTKSFWKILGIVVGCAVGVGIVWMLLWRYWLRPWRTKIRNARSEKRVAARRAQWAKKEAEAKAKAEQESGEKTDDGDNS